MKRFLVLFYGILAYVFFLATFLYLIGFIGSIVVPKVINGQVVMPTAQAFIIDFLLLALFAVQHSIMARPWFKKHLLRLIPEAAERSTFVLVSCLALIPLFIFWQPLGGTVWVVENIFASGVLWVLFALGWAMVLVSSFLINHFDLFGLRQVWLYFIGKPYTDLAFKTPFLYKFVRHPLYLGLLIGFWAAPEMSVARLVLAAIWTAYVLRAIRWEENDLVRAFGDTYRSYARRVPMIFPSFFKGNKKESEKATA